PWSLRNSSSGMSASDLRPALTTTKLWSMRTTSAEMTSPDFMSWFLTLSLKRSAKLSPPRAVSRMFVDISDPLAGMAGKSTPGFPSGVDESFSERPAPLRGSGPKTPRKITTVSLTRAQAPDQPFERYSDPTNRWLRRRAQLPAAHWPGSRRAHRAPAYLPKGRLD